jgi:hypothetical protein
MTALVIAATVACVPACAAIPTGGAVHLGRALPGPGGLDDLDVRVLPPLWHAGMSPEDVVTGFLRAMVNDDDDYIIARSYLTAAASLRWRPSSGVTTYDDSALQPSETRSGSARIIRLRAPRLGHVDARGDYVPEPGALDTSFTVVRSAGSWRIDKLQDGVLLSESDAQRTFRPADVYYLNRSGKTLVPEQILLQSAQKGVATALVTALLSGPSSWLAPAVRTAAPARTSVIGNVPVHDNGIADVNLSSAIRLASPADLAAFSAQVVWTLRQVLDVTAVRLLAEGAPLQVPDVPTRQPITSWSQFDPSAPPASRDVLYVHAGHLAATGGDAAELARSDPGNVVYVARSRDGATLAVVQRHGAGVRLLTGRLGHPLVAHVAAATMTPPTFDAGGDALTVVTRRGGRWVVAVTPSGAVRRAAADPILTAQPVTALRISRDGARVAAVVGTGRLLIGRVTMTSGAVGLNGFLAVAPTLHGVSGVAWAGADDVVVTASSTEAGQRQIVETDTEGYTLRQVPLDRMRGVPIDISAAPGQPLVAVTADGVIWTNVEGWRVVGAGTAAVHSG